MPGTALQLPQAVLRASPQLGNAALLAKAYNDRLLMSIQKVIGELGISPSPELADLADEPKLNPQLFQAYFDFFEARGQNINAVEPLLGALALTGSARHFEIDRLTASSWFMPELRGRHENGLSDGRRVRFKPISAEELASQRPFIEQAMTLLQSSSPGMRSDFDALVSQIILFRGETVVGLTSPRFHGAMLLALPNPAEDPVPYYLEHIVHETSHMYLNTVLGFDRLVLNDEQAVFDAPIRADPRPMLGVFHASFVLYRIVGVFDAALLSAGASRARLADVVADRRKRLQHGLEVLSKHATLTPWGRDILASMAR